jgi:hypothetical protein
MRVRVSGSGLSVITFDVAYSGFLVVLLLATIGQAVADGPRNQILEIILLALNGLVCVAGIFLALRRRRPLLYMSMMFSYLFFAVAPLAQIAVLPDPIFSEGAILLRGAVYVLASSLIGVGFEMLFRRKSAGQVSRVAPSRGWPLNKWAQFDGHSARLAFLVGGASILCFAVFGSLLFSSRATFSQYCESAFGPALAAVVAACLMSMPFYGSVMGLTNGVMRKSYHWVAMFSILLGAALAINNITIIARFKLFALLSFGIIYVWPARTRLIALLVGVGTIVAPAFHVFRDDGLGGETALNIEFDPVQDFVTMDYDAFQMLCYTIDVVDKNGIVWGKNIIGAGLFFIPREWWPGKPLASSLEIAQNVIQYRFSGTDNLSTPLIAEGFYAAGSAGLLVICLVYWWCLWRLEQGLNRGRDDIAFLLSCVLLGMTFIVLRGTLMVAIANVIGMGIAAWIPWAVLRGRLWTGGNGGSSRRLPTGASSER